MFWGYSYVISEVIKAHGGGSESSHGYTQQYQHRLLKKKKSLETDDCLEKRRRVMEGGMKLGKPQTSPNCHGKQVPSVYWTLSLCKVTSHTLSLFLYSVYERTWMLVFVWMIKVLLIHSHGQRIHLKMNIKKKKKQNTTKATRNTYRPSALVSRQFQTPNNWTSQLLQTSVSIATSTLPWLPYPANDGL